MIKNAYIYLKALSLSLLSKKKKKKTETIRTNNEGRLVAKVRLAKCRYNRQTRSSGIKNTLEAVLSFILQCQVHP